MENLVSVIIANWNGRKWLEECLNSLFAQDFRSIEIILVDNGSTDDSVRFVSKNYPTVTIIKNKENLGYAEANNIGFTVAKGKYILFLNNDVVVDRHFLPLLVDYLDKHPDVGAIQPKILVLDYPNKIQLVGSYLTLNGMLYHFGYGKDETKFNEILEIFSAVGACFLVRRELIEKIGLFDKDFFAYFEETDFCWRMWLAGYKVIFYPYSKIYHKGAAAAVKLKTSFIIYHVFKNKICSLIKNLSFSRFLIIFIRHLIVCFFASIYLIFRGYPSSSVAVYRALSWNLIHLKLTLRKRHQIQQMIRKVSDNELLPKIVRRARLSYFYYLYRGLEYYQD